MPRLSADREPLDRLVAQHQRILEERVPPPSPVAPGFDITGMPPIDELARAEQSARRRLNPRRLLGRGQGWTELQAVDQRIRELEQRHREAAARVGVLHNELARVDAEDADRVAEWVALGEGDRPVPRREALERELHDAEVEAEGLLRAIEHAERERERTIERHRDQMVADADDLVRSRLAEGQRIAGELRRAREELVDAADLAAWARHYPEAPAARRWDLLALDARRVHVGLGLTASTPAARLIDALGDDLDALAAAAGQRAEPKPATQWAGDVTDDQRRARLEAIAQAAAREFGVSRDQLTEGQFDSYAAAVAAGEVPAPAEW